MNETLFWITEYIKVLLAYVFLLYAWPCVVFKSYLKGKSRTFKFSFCTVAMISIVNAVVLLLGNFHILNVWVIRILFYGTFLFSIVRMVRVDKDELKKVKNFIIGTMGKKTFTQNLLGYLGRSIKWIISKISNFFKGNVVAYILLIIVLAYSMLYFSWNAFQDYSYGASDMYVHHKWIYGLVEGESFSAGIYPEGMHCIIYSLYSLFGVRIYSSLMMLAGINISVVLVSAYVMFKEMFKWKYTPILLLALFAVLNVNGTFPIQSMSRMAWTLPQEYAYPMIFLCGAYLIKYLKRKTDDKSKKFFDENLIVFTLALAGTVSIHFYATIMAFFVCLMIVIPLIPKLFKNKSFLKLFLSVLLGVFIAFVPMLAALATGKKFQGSIKWAISIISNSVSDNSILVPDKNNTSIKSLMDDKIGFVELASNKNDIGQMLVTRNIKRGKGVSLKEKRQEIYNKTYVFQHGSERAGVIFAGEFAVLLIWIVLKIVSVILHKKDEDFDAMRYDGYIMLVLLGVAYNLLNNTRALGLPEFMEVGRVCALAHILSIAIFFVPIDLIMSLGFISSKKIINSLVGITGIIAVVMITVLSGNYHGYLFYCLGRYNGAVESAFSIINDTAPSEFTVVSTTEEYYQLVDYGYHEELVDFVNSAYYKDTYTLPTKYVFVFVEKKPIKYPHYHFASGPSWLANESYYSAYGTMASQDPDVFCSEISDEIAKTDYGLFPSGTISVYSNLNTRTKLESKVNAWCEEFDRLYPGELHTYYEDDSFVCYYFKQNQRSIYELSIMKNETE